MTGQRKKVGDAAIRKATGKTWDQWLTILDRAGAKKRDHKGIVAILAGEYDVGPWWQQMIAVGYEQSRGLRKLHQRNRADFSISASRTISAPPQKAFRAWHDAKQRARWLESDGIVIRRSTPTKSLRITWPDHTDVQVQLLPRSESKVQIAVEHNKLPTAIAARRMKLFWSDAVQRLKNHLERAR